MSTQTQPTAKPHSRRGMGKVWIMSLAALLVLVAPLIVSWQLIGIDAVQAEFSSGSNPRAEYWREVREGTAGVTTVKGQETGELIENSGQNWRQVRNGPLATLGAWLIGIVVALLILFHLTVGRAKLKQRTGRKILRWTVFERTLHWFVAILFILLAITGLSLLYGRAVLIPVMGYDGFAAYAQFAKWIHDYLSLFFVVGLVVMLAMWFSENFFTRTDWEWFKKGGGYLGKGHGSAYKVNAGEKVWFWILLVAGIGLMISGIVLLLPNLGFERGTMQGANIIHAITALVLSAFALGHIYLGTIGNEGTFEGMISGEVDEAWAKQHHDLWYQETGGKGAAAEGGGQGEPGKAAGQPTAT
ncbi:MAG: formate dehydrogenase subunit gamma [Thiohalophilus sp.]|uniref:formate dehydrogenase subunit gamma n=1 Tax=Thiohalophilus sp. TaxID=3028392 RepID=UPI002870411B|nr:formate dehydrogenase subunit gamma [Thiohalophilus sp.]MDR9436856.1 formate dehydrogenase subunit gamma [Thiohalophilus sp.]